MTLEAIRKKLSKYSKEALIKVIVEDNFIMLDHTLNRLKDIEFDETLKMRGKVFNSILEKRIALDKLKFGCKEFISTLQELEKLQRKHESLCKKTDSLLKI